MPIFLHFPCLLQRSCLQPLLHPNTDKKKNNPSDKIDQQLESQLSGVDFETQTLPVVGQIPDLEHKVIFTADVVGDRKGNISKAIIEMRNTLRNDSGDFASWTDLANLVSSAGDSSYAIEILKFVATNTPDVALPVSNMGMIYGYYLHDNVNAEIYFKQAIAREPQTTYYYIQLYQFYMDIGKKDKARQILRDAITERVPGYQDLQLTLNAIK